MNKFWIFITGIILIVHGLYSIYTSLNGGPLRGLMLPPDTLIRKFFGENAHNTFFNLFWGLTELILGIGCVIEKFN